MIQKETMLILSDLRGSATTDMQGVESSILWSSSEDRQSLLCGGSILSSESISSASNETKQKQKSQNLQTNKEKTKSSTSNDCKIIFLLIRYVN